MNNLIEMIAGSVEEKKEWKKMEARAKALPDEYRIVYGEIKHYIWKSSGIGSIDPFRKVLELFEESVAMDKNVLDVTGTDVAAFCDELVKDEKSYTQEWRDKLNRTISNKLNK